MNIIERLTLLSSVLVPSTGEEIRIVAALIGRLLVFMQTIQDVFLKLCWWRGSVPGLQYD